MGMACFGCVAGNWLKAEPVQIILPYKIKYCHSVRATPYVYLGWTVYMECCEVGDSATPG